MEDKRFGKLRLEHLQAFVLTIDSGTQVAAAKRMGCSQSVVSRYISDLEKWLGQVLTYSSTVELTDAGSKFLPVAKEVITLLTEAKASFASDPQAERDIDPKSITI